MVGPDGGPMKYVIAVLPLVLALGACKKDDDVDSDALCALQSIEVPVTVVTLNDEPILDAEVTITQQNPDNPDALPSLPLTVEEDCSAAGDGAWTCTAVQGGLNQVNAQKFPEYQPTSAVAYIEDADCESVAIELRMPPITK